MDINMDIHSIFRYLSRAMIMVILCCLAKPFHHREA